MLARDDAAVDDRAGEDRLGGAGELLANGRSYAVGGDHHLRRAACLVGEHDVDRVLVLARAA